MPKKYDVIDELIEEEIKEFIFWLSVKKKIELCEYDNYIDIYYPIGKAAEDLINEYMEAE